MVARVVIVLPAVLFGLQVPVIIIFVVIYYTLVRPYFRRNLNGPGVDVGNEPVHAGGEPAPPAEGVEEKDGKPADGEEPTDDKDEEKPHQGEEKGEQTENTYERNRQSKTETDCWPSYWSKGGEDYSTIDITDYGEFIKQMVYNLWDPEEVGKGRDAQEVGNNKYIKITNVERVENLPLFREYNMKRQSLLKKKKKIKRIKDLSELSGSGIQTTNCIYAVPQLLDSPLEVDICHDINEHYLFHGTSSDNVESICREGLKIQYAGLGLFGKGIYAAEDPTKSDQYTDPQGNKGKTILLCRANLGEMYVANRPAIELKSPPCRTRGCYEQNCKEHKYRFDSAVGDIPGHRYREFILYKDHRIYPEYIITYDRTDDPTEMMAYKSA